MGRIFTIILFLASLGAQAAETIVVSLPAGNDNPHESVWRDALAAALRARGDTVATEVTLKGGRADIVTQTYAIEVDRAHKWHESIGQSAHYALMLHLKPAIALIGADKLTSDQLTALKALCTRRRIEIFYITTEG